MKKFFLFRREQLTLFSCCASDDGTGLALLVIPADKLSFITAKVGEVIMRFDEASIYDYVTTSSAESINKTRVAVATEEGKEVDLINSIMNFLSSSSKENVLRFDAVEKESTLKGAKVDGFEDITSIINSTPTNVITQETSDSTSIVAGVDFLTDANLPFIDFNHEQLLYSDGQHASAWDNAPEATGGSTYDMTDEGASNTLAAASSATSKVLTTSVNILAGNYYRMGVEMEHSGDYTLYCAYGMGVYTNQYEIYSSSDGTGKGFTNGKFDLISLIHNGLTGLPATQITDNTDNGSISYKLPDPMLEVNSRLGQSLYAFVVRRDKDFNIFVHGYTGEIIAVIPAVTGGVSTTSFRTDGDLAIKNIGGVTPGYLFKGYLARFGVIKRDIGYSAGKKIAQDLYKQYARNYSF